MDDTTFTSSTKANGFRPYGLAYDAHTRSIWGAISGTGGLRINDTSYTATSYPLTGLYIDVYDPHTQAIWMGSLISNNVTEFSPSE